MLDEPAIASVHLGWASKQSNGRLNALAKAVGQEMLQELTLYKGVLEDLNVGNTQ